MDDFIIFHSSKQYLKYCLDEIILKIKEEKLEINNKTNIYNLKEGVNFLGYRFILKNKKLIIKIKRKNKVKIKKKIRILNKYNKIKLERVKASYRGYIKFSNCFFGI